MTFEYWIYVVTYISIFGFFVAERYKQGRVFSITKRDILFLLIDIIAKLVHLTLAVYAMLGVVNFISPFEILSLANLPIPMFLNVVIAFLLVDLFHYLSHRLHHKVPILWRFHRLHHSDKKVDVLTTFLHHPFEIISTFLVNVTCYVLLDIPVIIILGYALFSAVHSPFTHTTLFLHEKLDRFLSYFIITPNFHRLHHSLDVKEGNSNFGIVFPFWDKLFGTCCYVSNRAVSEIKFGVSADKSPQLLSFKELLVNPFR
jgi:sterol desaturase/sphingolipid hydroxylase (fatty acid hydroxylase superfamily)